MHDIGEIIIGDISEKNENKNELKKNEKESVKRILSNLSQDNSEYYYKLWEEMNEQKTEIAIFAHLLDKIDAIMKAEIYENKYKIEGLFEDFYLLQKETFQNSILKDFYNYIGEKYRKTQSQ